MKPNRISCAEVREKLPLYVGADLDAEVLDAVRGHLELCGECARVTARATTARVELVAALRALEQELDPPTLWPDLRAKLLIEGRIRADGGEEVAAIPVRARRARWLWALAPLAAAAALLFFMRAGEELAPGRLPNSPGARGLSAPELVVAPVAAPRRGTLETIPPDEVSLPAPYRDRARRGSRGPGDDGVSLAGYNKRIK
jgi:hypothetical protein